MLQLLKNIFVSAGQNQLDKTYCCQFALFFARTSVVL
jgi:hypothetical protein